MKQFISLDSRTTESKDLLKSYSHFMAGLFSLPIRLPGTTYSNCLKGQEEELSALKNVFLERRKEKRIVKEDFLDQVLEKADDDKEYFSDQVILDFLFGFLFAGYDTMSIAITMDIKYLMETTLGSSVESWKGYRETTSLSTAPGSSDRNSQVPIRIYQGRHLAQGAGDKNIFPW